MRLVTSNINEHTHTLIWTKDLPPWKCRNSTVLTCNLDEARRFIIILVVFGFSPSPGSVVVWLAVRVYLGLGPRQAAGDCACTELADYPLIAGNEPS